MMAAIVHLAGEVFMIGERFMRQRCGWCGDVLIDYDLSRVAVPVGTDPMPATWQVGSQVLVDGGMSTVVESEKLDDRSCASLEVRLL